MRDETPARAEVLQGTLILLVLHTLEALGPLYGYGIARRIGQISEELLQLNQGTLYPALLHMEQENWISAKWGISENSRRAKFYSITPRGRKQLAWLSAPCSPHSGESRLQRAPLGSADDNSVRAVPRYCRRAGMLHSREARHERRPHHRSSRRVGLARRVQVVA